MEVYAQEALRRWHIQVGAIASHISVPISIEHFRDSDNAIRAKTRRGEAWLRADAGGQSAGVDWE